jgi:glyceraldehyde 3-phosphate dehydrogenase
LLYNHKSLGLIRVFINGFGRIGQSLFKILQKSSEFKIVGINDIRDIDMPNMPIFKESDPNSLDLTDVDIFVQSSGKYLKDRDNQIYLKNGAKIVVITAPSDTKTFLYGINHTEYNKERIISSSSCSVTAVAPIIKVLQQYGIKGCYVSMVHPYTNDQQLLDSAKTYKDIRRVRSATTNILPLYSTLPKAIKDLYPKVVLEATSIRVPIAYSTYYDLTIQTSTKVNQLEKIIRDNFAYTYENKVSQDFINSPHPITIDLNYSSSYSKMIKISGWQDSEYGYSYQLVKLLRFISG